MHSTIAYVLSVLAMPFVALAAAFINLPLFVMSAAGILEDRTECFLIQTITACLMVTASWWIFGWLDQPFTLGPVLVIGVLTTCFSLSRVMLAMSVWSGWLEANEFTRRDSADVLCDFNETNEAATKLYHKIGQEWAYTIGGVAGTALAGWWFIYT